MRFLSAIIGATTLFAGYCFGQTAKDFTLADITGKSHHLYEYLDAGKFVAIDFTTPAG